MRRYFPHFRVGRQRYGPNSLGTLVEPQQKVFAVPPISVDGDLYDIHPMRRGSVKSFVDDLVLGRGVVISRAATSLRSVETQPLTRRFVRNQTNDISVPSLSRGVGGLSLCLAAGARSPLLLASGDQLGGERAHHGSLDCGSRLAASAGVAPRSLGPFSQVRARDTHGGVSVLGLSLFLVRPLGSEARRFDSCRGHSFSMCASPRSHAVSFRKSWVLWPVTHADDPSLPPPIQHENEQVLPRHPVCVCVRVCLCLSQVSLHAPRPTSLWSRSLVSLPSDSGFLWPVSKTINVPGVSFGFTQSPKSSVCLRPL